MSRATANLQLAMILQDLIQKHPELRFSQILQNYNFVVTSKVTINAGRGVEYEENVWQNEFYTEPEEVLRRVQEKISDIENSKGQSTT